MTTIKRFNPDYKMHAARFEAFAREAEHGELVQFDDHQQVVSAVEAERDALADKCDRLEYNLGNAIVGEQKALQRVNALAVENARYSMSAGQADQRMAESRAVRSALGFNPDAEDVSPSDLVEAINQITAELCVIRTANPQPLGPAMDAAIDAFNAEEMPETGMLNAYFIMRDSIRVETPATDAALAAIEARGVEKFADMCREKSKLATTADSCAGWKNCSVHASSFAIRLREAK
ncbi:hypothetical protein PTR13_04055 [Serratia bockelmannii]|uniref:hypothetical protein n=1 Tax=Serratia TaxID=613 RepID=UPI00313C37A5